MELVRRTKMLGRLPVVNFAAGGVATPADAALMMQVCFPHLLIACGPPAVTCCKVIMSS